jgi:Ca2+/H+ antiporter, TMEM165/GDT1 family
MKIKRFRRGLMFLAIAALAATAFSFVVMYLWNWLAPEVFGGHTITIWKAFGLLVLSRILLGGFRPGFGPMRWRHRMRERWEQMTPEEREKFRQGMRGRCGWRGTKSASPVPAPGEFASGEAAPGKGTA